MDADKIFDFSDAAKSFAMKDIQNGLSILKLGDFRQYFDYCIKHLNNAADTGAVLRYLLGSLEGKILDLRLVDVSPLFEGNPSPSWVAASLVAMKKI